MGPRPPALYRTGGVDAGACRARAPHRPPGAPSRRPRPVAGV